VQDKYQMFRNRLAKVYAHRRKQARRQGISCYRLYDLDLPEFPLAIDMYEDQVHVAEYQRNHQLTEAEHQDWLDQSKGCIADVLEISADRVHIKQRRVISERQQQYNKVARHGEKVIARENGLKFYLNLTDYLDTGLFLDHRPTRELVPFSVYAAAGGARKVTTVDLSNTYIEWAQDNFRLNQLDPSKHRFVTGDVLAFLEKEAGNRYDLIICDPPTFSNSKKTRGVFDVQRDHPGIINHCLRLLRNEGLLYFSTNNRRFRLFDDHINTTRIKDITRETTGFDFSGKLNRLCYEIRPESR